MFAGGEELSDLVEDINEGSSCGDGRYEMPLATTPGSIVDADRHGTQSEFHVLADGISDGIRKRRITWLPEGSASILSGMMLGPTIHYILGLRAEASCKGPPNQPGEDRA